MSYHNNLSIDTRTCGEAKEDAELDKKDGLVNRITTNRARWAAAHKRLDAMENKEMQSRQEELAEVHYSEWAKWADEQRKQLTLCQTCKGHGSVGFDVEDQRTCPACNGTGKDLRGCEWCGITHHIQR